ncbi:MFS transporter [Prescottella subtropica]|uniref:MFS transporter n=1 Tax=Prescottella subtropica TaxID=2545757 RepID=UPI0010F45D6F|nr:MFS transporter [Prescottella subtropica]
MAAFDGTTDGIVAPDERGWSPRLIFSLVSIVLVLELLSVSYMMISMALPAITADFDTAQGAWLLTAFLLLGAVAAPLVGKLADMYGKRRLLLVCIVISILGSLMSAVATSYAVMIAGRALAGLLVPCLFLSYSLIRDVFPPKTVPLAVSIATAGMGLITVAAPFLAGWLIDGFGWRSIFWFSSAILVVLAFMLVASTPETTVRLRSRVDFLGAALLGSGIAGVLVAISFGPTWGWAEPATLLYLVGGIALVAAWYATAKRISDPLIRLDVLRRRPIFLTVTAAGSVYGVGALYSIMLPLMAMTSADLGLGYGFGLSAEGYAVFQVPIGVMTMVGGIAVGILCGRGVPTRTLLAASMVVAGTGAALTALEHDSKPWILLFAGIVGLGIGLGYAAIPNILIVASPPELQASTASIAGVVQSLISGVMPVIAFAVMNNSFVAALSPDTTGGAAAYTDGGFVAAFVITAVTAVLGVVAALALPRRIEQLDVDIAPSAAATVPARSVPAAG